MSDIPPLNALRAFEVSGRRLSFRAAADELGVTQGAVAQHVRQLEASLGISLFDRLPKGLALTGLGRSYHSRVAAAFQELRDATEQLKPEPSKVLISVTPTLAAKWLIPNLPAFSEAHPEIDLRILATEKVSSFHSDGIDLAIRQGAPPFGAALQATRLFARDVIAVAAPSLVEAYPTPVDADTLARLPKIHDAHEIWPRVLSAIGVEDQSARNLRLSQTALAVDAAISGQGVALVNRFLAERDLAANKLVEIAPIPLVDAQDFYLLALRKKARTPAVKAVAAWLEATAS
ncbi:MAG: LysR substrate-binding domain-containing protein [Pseudomonadota bacterium]